MIEERITETTDAQGNVVERTIERDTGNAVEKAADKITN